MAEVITGITFSPVQTFIEKSRKLRDLYGSSYLLSFLSWSICHAAQRQNHQIISPALPNVVQGMPNKILIAGDFAEKDAKTAFDQAWKCMTEPCQEWVQERFEPSAEKFYWKRDWGLWSKYTWEFFWVQGQGITVGEVRRQLEARKNARNWVGINWQGESSTLSGADAVAHPGLGAEGDPRKLNYQVQRTSIAQFYTHLSRELGAAFLEATPDLDRRIPASQRDQRIEAYGAAFIDPDEELSIPELVKRLITHKAIARRIIERVRAEAGSPSDDRTDDPLVNLLTTIEAQFNPAPDEAALDLDPGSFRDLSRLSRRNQRQGQQRSATQGQTDDRWTGWFHGDGDRAGSYLDGLDIPATHRFSEQMRHWGEYFQAHPPEHSRVIYAGGDDFLGIFYRSIPEPKLEPKHCVDYFCRFKEYWNQPNPKPITPSVGFVWAGAKVPQRDVLQHCRDAEKSAKTNGRDRVALRVLFNSGNFLEWVCPWHFLPVLQDYRDLTGGQNWTHLYNDVAVLEARHAFAGDQIDVALALFEIYFGQPNRDTLENHLWDKGKRTGILGNRKEDCQNIPQALNHWIINLAKVGFHLCSNT